MFRDRLLWARTETLQVWLGLLVEVSDGVAGTGEEWFTKLLSDWRVQSFVADVGCTLEDNWNDDELAVVREVVCEARMIVQSGHLPDHLYAPDWSLSTAGETGRVSALDPPVERGQDSAALDAHGFGHFPRPFGPEVFLTRFEQSSAGPPAELVRPRDPAVGRKRRSQHVLPHPDGSGDRADGVAAAPNPWLYRRPSGSYLPFDTESNVAIRVRAAGGSCYRPACAVVCSGGRVRRLGQAFRDRAWSPRLPRTDHSFGH
jgi:hypothetical protein